MKFLGTSAAELLPNPFCTCEVCERARIERAIPRRRSAMLYDDTLCIDFGPDIFAAAQQYNVRLHYLRDVLITHTHVDHLSIQNIGVLENSSNYTDTLNLHMSPKALKWLNRYCELCGELYGGKTRIETLCEKGRLRLCEVKPYEWNDVGGRRVFAVESNHRGYGDGEYALNYIIEGNDGSRLMYATDTGLYSDENIAALKDFGCSTLVMEGTTGSRDTSVSAGHLNAKHFVENVRRFRDAGVIKPDAYVYVTHINQVNIFSHDEYQEYVQNELGERVFVAYDGLEI